MFSHDDFRRAVGTLVNAEFIGINCGSLLISTPDSGFLNSWLSIVGLVSSDAAAWP